VRALEKMSDIRSCAAAWKKAFAVGARAIGKMDRKDVLWHEGLGIWGVFSRTHGRGGNDRDWNTFGQKPNAFVDNRVVEINYPPTGIDRTLQAVFAIDQEGHRWILHQGRMSVPGLRVTQSDFIAGTGLTPIELTFSDSSTGLYHRVATLDAEASVLQDQIAAFISKCGQARAIKSTPHTTLPDLAAADEWERGLSPEAIGDFEITAKSATLGTRRHGEVWSALCAELKGRNVLHSNDRILRYGPDLFTYGEGPKVLFEIKSSSGPRDVYEAVGQLQIYDRLLGGGHRLVLVIPKGVTRPPCRHRSAS
jgi:hypothetical protein